MDYYEMTVKTAHEGLELLCDMMGVWGIGGLIIEDEGDFKDFLKENRGYWDYVDEDLTAGMENLSQLRFFVDEKSWSENYMTKLQKKLDQLKEDFPGVNFGRLESGFSVTKSEDWENNWKAHYKPFPLGKALYIKPSWDESQPPADKTVLLIDPGLIFGTGTHASTKLCLEAIEDLVKGGERVLDLGSGSGILSIAALLLGAGNALCVDLDPIAEDVARGNAALNGLDEGRLRAVTGNVLEDETLVESLLQGPWDLVFANIVADVIIALSPLFERLLAPGGRLLCSGIIEGRADETRFALLENGLELEESRSEEGWFCFTAKKARTQAEL